MKEISSTRFTDWAVPHVVSMIAVLVYAGIHSSIATASVVGENYTLSLLAELDAFPESHYASGLTIDQTQTQDFPLDFFSDPGNPLVVGHTVTDLNGQGERVSINIFNPTGGSLFLSNTADILDVFFDVEGLHWSGIESVLISPNSILFETNAGVLDSQYWSIAALTGDGTDLSPFQLNFSLAPSVFLNSGPDAVTSLSLSFDITPTAVPLPASAWLFFSGLGAISFLGRYRLRS